MNEAVTYYSGKRRGRPPKNQEDITHRELTKEILDQIVFSGDYSDEQVDLLKNTLKSTLNKYQVEKDEIKVDTIKDSNIEVLNDFLASKRVESKSETTIYNYGNEISKMFFVLNKPYQEITSNDIRRYMDYRKQHDRLKSVSVHNIRMYLMSFFKYLYTEELIPRNPMDKIAPVKMEQHVIETLYDEEAEMIRCACDNERDIAIIDMLSGSGMRVSELTGLNRDDVNFDNGEIKVFGKGSKERICFLTGKAKVHLRWYLEQRVDTNPALFVTAKKPYSRLTKNGVEYILKTVAKNSKVPRTRLYPHKYRSTLASNMINKGASADKVQRILGHQSVNTTLTCYVNADTETIKREHNQYVS